MQRHLQQLKNERPTWCHLLFYFTSYVLNMFRTYIYPSSGACDCVVELPHRSSCSQFVVCWRFGVAGFEWCSCCRLKPENKTTDVIIHQHSRKLLMMDILMSETCWAHKKWNKIASDIKLVFHSSAIIAMMHGPINIRCTNYNLRKNWLLKLDIFEDSHILLLFNCWRHFKCKTLLYLKFPWYKSAVP